MADCLLQGKQFYCREWAFSKINHCLENRPTSKTCGALVMGGPGCGKTSMCCELVWPTTNQGKQVVLNRRLLAYYFCQAHDIDTLSLTNFIHALVDQLSRSNMIQDYKEKLKDKSIQKVLDSLECEKNPDAAFKEAILDPLNSIEPPPKTVFILVDSIDESYLQSISDRTACSKTIAELLANHHHLFPEWLLLVCSSRKQSRSVTRMFTGFRKISLDDLRKSHVVRDVQQYILCRLDQEEELRQHLSRETAEMLNQLHIKSNGCFLYLEKVLDGVAENFIMLREIREIPGTLNGLYLWLCQRLFVRKQFTKIQAILNVILASRHPLSEDELFSCVKTKNSALVKEEFSRRLQLLSKILTEGKGSKKILFHHSFAEWLLDVKHCTQKYLCSAPDGHGMLAMYASLNTANHSPQEVQDFAWHLVRTNLQPPVEHFHLVQWMLVSGANIESSLSGGLPKEQKVLKMLMDGGAQMPVDDENDAASMQASMEEIVESPKTSVDIDAILEQVDSNGRSVLHTAAHQGNLELVTMILARDFAVDIVDKSGQTSLNLAARHGHSEVVCALLNAGAAVDHTDNDGWTALRSAAWGGQTNVVSQLLESGAEIDLADTDQRTALRAAAWGGHEEIVIKLLQHGADVNKADNEGRTALIAAAYMGHREIVEHLLNYKADVNHEDRDGRTALSVAALCIPASEGHENVVSLLLERGAEVNHQDKDGMTPLLVAACEGHRDVCEMLLEWDADVDHLDHNGRTALLAAASMGHADVVNQLLFWGAAVDTIDSEGRTVLSIASAQGNIAVVQQLLDRGLDEMHRDNTGWTPLHMAAYEGHSEVCRLLLEQGAKVNEIDNDGRIPLNNASQEGHLAVVSMLLEHGSTLEHKSHDGKTPMRMAALEGHREIVQFLLDQCADFNYRDADGRSTLYVVALENKPDMAEYLLERGAEVESSDLEGRTALHVAAWQGHYEITELLMKYNANVNAVDNDQRTALQSAAWQGNDKVVQLLLEKGAHVDHTCNQGATALCIAAQEGHEGVVRVLLQFGANPNHADQFGRTPMRVSLKSGHNAVCKLLEDFGANPVSGMKSRSSSSNSSNEAKPTSSTATDLSANPNSANQNSSAPATNGGTTMNGNILNSSPSDSPESTFDRRKSYLSNNSSKSSSNMTSSTNQSSQSAHNRLEGECLTFTQQLQQCSMARHRSRPISRVLSPVSEPQTPVQSPPMSPAMNLYNHNNQRCNGHSPHLEQNLNIALTSPVKMLNSKTEKISATINIITNPNADLSDEPIWQINPISLHHMKSNIARLEFQRRNSDQPSKMVMGQSALEMRSPEMRRKRNGIVTNPNLTKSIAVNGHLNRLSNNANIDTRMPPDGSPTILANILSNGYNRSTGMPRYKGPPRPNGLPIKKETPL
ncbi:hypothetical protein ScPMuIL_009918 [Solemya velum]